MSNIKNWSTTPASNNSASPNGAPEGMAPSAVNDIMRQQMADHRTQWQDGEWFDWGHVPTRTGNTTFTVPTDQTAVYTANRRLKCSDASTIYASILSSSYTAVTTITVVNGTGNLSASLTAVAVSVFSSPAVANASIVLQQLLPAGVIAPYAGSTAPTGWLACDGSAVSRTTYSALFTALSTTWGVGDGVTTFNVPDLRGRSPIGDGTGTVAESVTDANVSTGGDTFTVTSNSTKWVTGQAVVLTTTTTLPTGLSLATTYYVIRASATTIKFASSLANAQNGTPIDITGVFGSGTHTLTGTLTVRTLGQNGGEEAHAMSITELLAHFHTGTNTGVAGTSVLRYGDGTGSSAVFPASATGGNVAMNVMHPFVVVKYIISY